MSLATSLVQLTVNIYLAVRLVLVQLPFTPRIRDAALAMKKLSFSQAISIIVLNLLTLVPNAIKLNLIAQYVPFTCGSLLVLSEFSITTHSNLNNLFAPSCF